MHEQSKTVSYRIQLNPEPEGGFTVLVPALPGCITYGRNAVHALAMAQEAIELYLEVLVMEGKPVTPDTTTRSATSVVQVNLPAPG